VDQKKIISLNRVACAKHVQHTDRTRPRDAERFARTIRRVSALFQTTQQDRGQSQPGSPETHTHSRQRAIAVLFTLTYCTHTAMCCQHPPTSPESIYIFTHSAWGKDDCAPNEYKCEWVELVFNRCIL